MTTSNGFPQWYTDANVGPGTIYLVEPTGPFMDDPNLTDKKYPGNPTKSYRSREPLRVVGEYWIGRDTPLKRSMP